MIVYEVDKLLEKIDKSPYWLAKETGISYPTISSIVKNKSQGMTNEILEKICIVLDCEPGDIIKRQK